MGRCCEGKHLIDVIANLLDWICVTAKRQHDTRMHLCRGEYCSQRSCSLAGLRRGMSGVFRVRRIDAQRLLKRETKKT